jgi:hypothetical protein
MHPQVGLESHKMNQVFLHLVKRGSFDCNKGRSAERVHLQSDGTMIPGIFLWSSFIMLLLF